MATFTAWIENSQGESFSIEVDGDTVQEVATDLVAHLQEENHVPPFSEWVEGQLSATEMSWSAEITEVATGEKFTAYLTAETTVARDVIEKAKSEVESVLESQNHQYPGYDFIVHDEVIIEIIDNFMWVPDIDDTVWDVTSKLSEYLEDQAASGNFDCQMPIIYTYDCIGFYQENWVDVDEWIEHIDIDQNQFPSKTIVTSVNDFIVHKLDEALGLLSEIVANYADSDFE